MAVRARGASLGFGLGLPSMEAGGSGWLTLTGGAGGGAAAPRAGELGVCWGRHRRREASGEHGSPQHQASTDDKEQEEEHKQAALAAVRFSLPSRFRRLMRAVAGPTAARPLDPAPPRLRRPGSAALPALIPTSTLGSARWPPGIRRRIGTKAALGAAATGARHREPRPVPGLAR